MARMGILVLFLILEKSSQLFTIVSVFSCEFVIYGLYYVEVCSFCTYFVESICHMWMLNFVNIFFCNYWDDHIIFILHLVNVMCMLIDLWMLNHPSISGINPTWSWCMFLLIYCWVQFTNILLRIFASVFIMDRGL